MDHGAYAAVRGWRGAGVPAEGRQRPRSASRRRQLDHQRQGCSRSAACTADTAEPSKPTVTEVLPPLRAETPITPVAPKMEPLPPVPAVKVTVVPAPEPKPETLPSSVVPTERKADTSGAKVYCAQGGETLRDI